MNQRSIDRLAEHVQKRLAQLKIKGANAQISADGDTLTVLITYQYNRPERSTIGKHVVNGILVGYRERIDYGWSVHIVARNGKLL